MPGTDKTRKKRDTSRKRKIILDCAVRVFMETGYDISSMDRIADVAGVSKRTIYNHFPSKEILFRAIIGDFVRQRDEMKPIEYSHDLPLADQLKRFAEAELFLIDDPIRRGISKFLTSYFLMDTTRIKQFQGQIASAHHEFINWLEAARVDNKLSYDSPQMVARMFYGLVEGCLTYPALLMEGANLCQKDELLDELVSLFLCKYAAVNHHQ
jgi:TetR/AcrR family transcriptional regulator, regulator of autoinduction and epiphytic fitness